MCSIIDAGYDRLPLSIRTDLAEVVRCMKLPDSGLDVKTRMWLKITIPQAFIGKMRSFTSVENMFSIVSFLSIRVLLLII